MSSFPKHPLPGQLVLGTYQVLQVGRRRPTGVQLIQALDLASSQVVAMKRQPLESGQHEAALLAGLAHPGIPRFFAHRILADESFLIHEWIEGARLGVYRRRLALADVLALGHQLADVLAYLHARRIVHCDLDAENALLAAGPRLVVIDFGLAQQFPPGDADFTDYADAEIGISRRLLATLLSPAVPRRLRRFLLTARAPTETVDDLLQTLTDLASSW